MYDYLSKLGKVSYSYYADMCVCTCVCVHVCVCVSRGCVCVSRVWVCGCVYPGCVHVCVYIQGREDR